jgi:hypothetical protein
VHCFYTLILANLYNGFNVQVSGYR